MIKIKKYDKIYGGIVSKIKKDKKQGSVTVPLILILNQKKQSKLMSWQLYFDRIYVISLGESERKERLIKDFREYGIKFNFWTGIKCEDGREGIYLTLMNLFSHCLEKNMSRVAVFEDDCKFLVPPDEFNEKMDEIVRQARMINWWQLKLGSVLIREAGPLVTPNIFQMNGSYGLHASAYTSGFMRLALSLTKELPVDVSWAKSIEPNGKCYHTYPLLASQYDGNSSIDKCYRNWDEHIQGAFKKHTSKINLLNSGNVLP